jgi:hypothetical protein
MEETQLISCLRRVATLRVADACTGSHWAPVLRECCSILAAMDPESPSKEAILDKLFWLVLVTEGASLFDS